MKTWFVALSWIMACRLTLAGEWVQVRLTHYCPCRKCCGPEAAGITASGQRFRPGALAADPSVPFGSRVFVAGEWRVVLDRGKDIRGARLDLAVSSHRVAKRMGVMQTNAWFEHPPALVINHHASR